MTRLEATFLWLAPLFEKLIDIQKEGGRVYDGKSLLDTLHINQKDLAIFEKNENSSFFYYGRGWTDEQSETKKYWRVRLKEFTYVLPQDIHNLKIPK